MAQQMILDPKPSEESRHGSRDRRLVDVTLRVLGKWTGSIGFVIFILAILVTLAAPLLAPYDPYEMDTGDQFEDPSREHWMGTDEFGRDILSRIIYGSQISLAVSTLAMSLAAIIGVSIGVSRATWMGLWRRLSLQNVTNYTIDIDFIREAL